MKQKRNKPRYNAQFKTFNSQQSCIDVFSRVQSLFLQKFYRYNLSDYFQDAFINVQQDIFIRKIKNKQLRQLASQTFLTKLPIKVHELVDRMNNFYNMQHSQIPQSFKYLYGNAPFDIGQKEIVIVQVKMRAQIEKVENLPNYFYREVEECQEQFCNLQEKEQQQLIKHLSKYDKKVLNLLIVYFGDINFSLFKRDNYTPKTISFFNNQLQVRIYVFIQADLHQLINSRKQIKLNIQSMSMIYSFSSMSSRGIRHAVRRSRIEKIKKVVGSQRGRGVG